MEPDNSTSLAACADEVLSSIAVTSQHITNFVRSERRARADLSLVARELSDLRLVLEVLRDDEHQVLPLLVRARLSAILNSCGEVIQGVAQLVAYRKDGTDRLRVWEDEDHVETTKFGSSLRMYREALGIVLEVENLSLLKDTWTWNGLSVDAEEVQNECGRILTEISELRGQCYPSQAASNETEQILQQYFNDLTAYTTSMCKEIVQLPQGGPVTKTGRPQSLKSLTPDHKPEPISQRFNLPRLKTTPAGFAPPIAEENMVANDADWVIDANDQSPLENKGLWLISRDSRATNVQEQQETISSKKHTSENTRNAPPVSYFRNWQRMGEPPGKVCESPNAASPSQSPSTQNPIHVAIRRAYTSYSTDTIERPRHARNRGSPQRATQTALGPNGDARSAGDKERAVSKQGYTIDVLGDTFYVPGTPSSNQSSRRPSVQTSVFSEPSYDAHSSVSTDGFVSVFGSGSDAASLSPHMRPKSSRTYSSGYPLPETPRMVPSSWSSLPVGDRSPKTLTNRRPSRTSFETSTSDIEALQSLRRPSSSADQVSVIHHGRNLPSPAPTRPLPAIPSSPSKYRRPSLAVGQVDLIPVSKLSDGNATSKGQAIFNIETTPSRGTLAVHHASHVIRIWDLETGTPTSTITYRSKLRAGPRSRMYFVRSHAILSESANLVAIGASFGSTIEVWDWNARRRLQSVSGAARWAAASSGIGSAVPAVAVYRAEKARLDLFWLKGGDEKAKKPLVTAPGRCIDLARAALPFVPELPELAFSATGPLLLGAAGPRPGRSEDRQGAMLMAWEVEFGLDSYVEQQHKAYRCVVVSDRDSRLSGALPAQLACYGSSAVSIWFPANYKYVRTASGERKRVPVDVKERLIVTWDLATNETRVLSIPDGKCCVSADCRYLAYCAAEGRKIVILDVTSGTRVWEGPDEEDAALYKGQLWDLRRVTQLQLTDDGGMLLVGDQDGDVGVYEVKVRPNTGEGHRRGGSASGWSS